MASALDMLAPQKEPGPEPNLAMRRHLGLIEGGFPGSTAWSCFAAGVSKQLLAHELAKWAKESSRATANRTVSCTTAPQPEVQKV